MQLAAATLRWQRWLVLAALVGSAWIVWPVGSDNFALPKATFLVVVAIAMVWCTLIRWSWSRRVVVPGSAVAVAAALFAGGMVLATITSTTPMQSLVGQYRQYAGLATYLACVVVFLSALRTFRSGDPAHLLRAFTVGTLGVAGYGLVQIVGADPADWSRGDQVIATMGNPNFAAGWLAIGLAPCLVVAARAAEHVAWRWAGAAGFLAGAVVLLETDSFQGPVAGAAAVVVAAGAIVGSRSGGWSWWNRRNVIAFGVLGLVGAAAALAWRWSSIQTSIDDGLYDRRAFWSAAWRIFLDNPLLGTGPDTFLNQFLTRRPVGHAGLNGGSVHDVPLDMLANGGLVVGVPFLAVLGLTGWGLWRAWRTSSGDRRLVVGGLAGGWAAYVVQASVSIDQPALAAAHWVLAGVVASLVPGRERVHAPSEAVGRQWQSGWRWLVPATVASAIVLAALVPVSRPMRAAAHVEAADDQRKQGDFDEAVRNVERARALAPWEASQAFVATRVYLGAGRHEDALAAAAEGAELEPGDVTYAVFAAQVHEALDRREALRWWDEALRRDPWGPATLRSAALAAGSHGDLERVEELLVRHRRISEFGALVTEAEALQLAGEDDRARDLWREVLTQDPDNVKAKESLEELSR